MIGAVSVVDAVDRSHTLLEMWQGSQDRWTGGRGGAAGLERSYGTCSGGDGPVRLSALAYSFTGASTTQ